MSVNLRILIFFIIPFGANAQWIDDFSSGNLTSWQGDTSSFIVNVNNQLQLNELEMGEKFIYRETKENSQTEWGIYWEMKFAPSQTNRLKIFLSMDKPDPNTSDAYYLEIGENGSNDNWKFYFRENGNISLLAQGESGKLSADPSRAYLNAKRNNDSSWTIKVDYNGKRNYTEVLQVRDSSNLSFSISYFGIYCIYTSTRADKFYFDDVQVSEPKVDKESPFILSHKFIGSNKVIFRWNENIDSISGKEISNYSFNSNIMIQDIKIESETEILIKTNNTFVQDQEYSLSYERIFDTSGNGILQKKEYLFKAEYELYPKLNDLMITEFMADPQPAIGLPEAEFIEIYNPTLQTYSLNGVKISDGSTISTSISNKFIGSKEYIILCNIKDTAVFKNFGTCIGVPSLPSLNNDEDQIILYNKDSEVIDQLSYKINWHTIESKSEGGYSLELVYPNQKCKGKEAWMTCSNEIGGTPGEINSEWSLDFDIVNPEVSFINPLSEWEISIEFNEIPDFTEMQKTSNYTIDPIRTIASIDKDPINNNRIIILLNDPLLKEVEYSLLINTIADCSGNKTFNHIKKFEILKDPDVGEILFNEILFNPKTGGVDYIEFYNNSLKEINLTSLYLNNLSIDTRWVKLNEETSFHKESYLVFSPDPSITKRDFPVHDSSKILRSILPSLDDTEGKIRLAVLRNGKFIILDSVYYLNDWHNPLIRDESGVALEKINPSLSSNSSKHWTSASSTVQYGSPGLKNSQNIQLKKSEDPISLESLTISPNQDGDKDYLVLHLNLDREGYKAKISVYDLSGNDLAVVNQTIVGPQDILRWDGTDHDGVIFVPGNYILLIELIHPEGQTQIYKKRFVVDYKQ